VIAERVRVHADWLALREPADAAARSAQLVDRLPPRERWIIHDLGSGTGSMRRWLAPRLPGPQHWVLHDLDQDLLALAGDGVETRFSDVTCADLSGATLITASALLDILTREELDRLVAACARAACPVLLALSVVGRVELDPPDPLDQQLEAAFNDHQRRATARGPLLGPDAVDIAAAAFRERGADVLLGPSPWRLGPADAPLLREWYAGWVAAAREQRPDLPVRERPPTAATVHHADLLVLP
jgi:hypothetical protein